MAVFGFNLTLTLLGVFFMRKLIPAFQFPSRFLQGFYRFYAPSEKDCREAANKPEKIIKDKRQKHVEQKAFVIPKNADVPLYFAPVKPDDFCFLHFYSEFCWLIEFTICALIVYGASSGVPKAYQWRGESVPDELNLSNIWLILGALFCGINLSRLSSRYLGSSGERSLLVMFGTFCFVACLSALTLPSRVIELGYEELIDNLDRVSKLGLTLVISLFSAIFGSAFAFPGFRSAQMNRDSANNAETPFKKLLLHGAFYSPLLVPLTFYPKLFRQQLSEESNIEFDWLPGALNDVIIDRIQLGLIVATSVWKICFWKSHLQAYLAVAKDRVGKMRKREKSYSQVDVQKNVTVVWYYSLVATLQYLLPSVLLIFLSLLLKSASGLTWYGDLDEGWQNPAGLENLRAGSWKVLFKYLIWLVSSAQALAVVGGYAFHSIIDTDL